MLAASAAAARGGGVDLFFFFFSRRKEVYLRKQQRFSCKIHAAFTSRGFFCPFYILILFLHVDFLLL